MTEPHQRLSRSAEDYLEAIGHLCQLHQVAQVSDIAEMLGVKKPSVTAAMRRLAELGLIDYHQYAPISLTEKGKRYADKVSRAHGILHRFMREIAGLNEQRADESACLIEHILTFEEIEGVARRMDAIKEAGFLPEEAV